MTWFSLASILLAAQPVQPGAEPPIARIVTMTGQPAQEDEDVERMVVRIDRSIRRFHLPAAQRQSIEQVLTAAGDRGFSVNLRFDSSEGQVDDASGIITYPICSVTVGTLPPVGDEAVNCPERSVSAQTGSRTLLARAVALVDAYPRPAIRMIGEALGDGELPQRLRAIALAARAAAHQSLANREDWASPSYDAQMVSALSDSRARLAIFPDRVGGYLAVATVLSELGAYQEALAVYADIRRRWPEEEAGATTAIGAIWRQRGDYRRALAVLDDHAARHGRPDGMQFAYHRAWMLVMLGRFQEAIGELEIGLASQPDYSGAYRLRSCARLALGQVDAARQDEERALELKVGFAREGESGRDDDIAQVRQTIAALNGTRGRPSAATLELSCRAPWRNWTRARPRSPLLPAAG
jgi:tetratricopeptide (TPR) repeat protein